MYAGFEQTTTAQGGCVTCNGIKQSYPTSAE